jgi:hypothetical protein
MTFLRIVIPFYLCVYAISTPTLAFVMTEKPLHIFPDHALVLTPLARRGFGRLGARILSGPTQTGGQGR